VIDAIKINRCGTSLFFWGAILFTFAKKNGKIVTNSMNFLEKKKPKNGQISTSFAY